MKKQIASHDRKEEIGYEGKGVVGGKKKIERTGKALTNIGALGHYVGECQRQFGSED